MNNKLRIVFLGTPEFAVESLDAIIKSGHEVLAVVTATDKPAGRGHKLLPSAVKQYALEHGIEVLQPEKLRDETFLARLKELNADLNVVIAFRMLPREVWDMPRLGTMNLHASLLPRYRGAAPINHAVMNGDTETGVTTFLLKHEIDTGDMLRQARIEIGPEENVGSVHDRLMHLGAEVVVASINDLANGTVTPIPQNDEEATPAPKIFKDTCQLHR
ncbi:MAG: methionyl-tRNA formyltransferase, partial [Muribaculaceae bacterium]|nr:methionyl-tRNA formyltransferase [Muribaculaceae bacterium]